MTELVLSQNKVFPIENLYFNPQNPLARFEFTCITQLFEAAGLTLVSLKNSSYTTKEHDSLIIHGENSPKYPNTFYWNSVGIGGGFTKAIQVLTQQGYTKNRTFYQTKNTDFQEKTSQKFSTQEKAIYFQEKSKGNLRSNFHSFSRKMGIPDALLKKSYVGTHKNKTAFLRYDLKGDFLGLQLIEYLPNGKRNKENSSSIQSYSIAFGCFGEHLFDANKKTFLVESAKTAVWATHFFPQFNFLATEGKNGHLHFQATYQRIKKKYPNYADQNFAQLIDYDEAGLNSDISKNLGFQIQKFVVKNSPNKGYDLADYLVDGHNSKKPFSLDLSKIIAPIQEKDIQKIKHFDAKNSHFLTKKYLAQDHLFTKKFLNFCQFHQRVAFQAPTGTGKSSFATKILIEHYLQQGFRVIYSLPFLSNIDSFSQKFIGSKIDKNYKVAIQASETGDYIGNCPHSQEAHLIISTFASLDKLQQIIQDENTVVIIDEFHKTPEHVSPQLFTRLQRKKGHLIAMSATPCDTLIEAFDLEKFSVQSNKNAQKIRFLNAQTPFEACLDYAKNFDFTKKRAFFAIRTIQEIEMLKRILIEKNRLQEDQILTLTSENKSEWKELVRSEKIPEQIKAVFATSVFEVGNNLYSPFDEIILCDNAHYPIFAEDAVQIPKRFRGMFPKITFFRKNNQQEYAFDLAKQIDRHQNLMSLVKNKLNLDIKGLNLNEIAQQQDVNLLAINHFVYYDSHTQQHEINHLGLLAYLQKEAQKKRSNQDFAQLMENYESFECSFEDYQFRELAQTKAQLSELRKEKKAKITAELERQKSILENAENSHLLETENCKVLLKRIAAFQKLGLDFENAKKAVLEHFSEVAYYEELQRQKIRYLDKTKAEKLSQKARFEKQVVEKFVQKIDPQKAHYKARELNDLFVQAQKEMLGVQQAYKVWDRLGKIAYQALNLAEKQAHSRKEKLLELLQADKAYSKKELEELGISKSEIKKLGIVFRYKTVKNPLTKKAEKVTFFDAINYKY